jgi:hypothetical protein
MFMTHLALTDRIRLAKASFKVGDRVMCNGYPGTIARLVGDGMAEIRLARGEVCVDLVELDHL